MSKGNDALKNETKNKTNPVKKKNPVTSPAVGKNSVRRSAVGVFADGCSRRHFVSFPCSSESYRVFIVSQVRRRAATVQRRRPVRPPSGLQSPASLSNYPFHGIATKSRFYLPFFSLLELLLSSTGFPSSKLCWSSVN